MDALGFSARNSRLAEETAKAELALQCARALLDAPEDPMNTLSTRELILQNAVSLSRWVIVGDDELTDSDFSSMSHSGSESLNFYKLTKAFGFGEDLFDPRTIRMIHFLFNKSQRMLIYAAYLRVIFTPHETLPRHLQTMSFAPTRRAYKLRLAAALEQ